MSGVFQNIDLPLPHFPATVYPPAFGTGGGHTRWVERGWGVFYKTPDTALYSSYVSTLQILYIFGGRIRSSEAAMDGGGAQRPVWEMSSKRRVRAAHGRARAAKTHQLYKKLQKGSGAKSYTVFAHLLGSPYSYMTLHSILSEILNIYNGWVSFIYIFFFTFYILLVLLNGSV